MASICNKKQFPIDPNENVDLIPTQEKNKIYLSIEPHAILVESGTDGSSGGGAEVAGIESDTDTVVNR